jgi:hypothetical protein
MTSLFHIIHHRRRVADPDRLGLRLNESASSMKIFRLAPMCMMFRITTLGLLALPVLFVLSAVFGRALSIEPTIFLMAIYSWAWLRFRPTQFVVHQDVLEVIWPLKRRQISRDSISDVRLVNRRDLKLQLGWGMRVGDGGLWGGFGWLWTQRRGIVQMYISRFNDLVWIERTAGRPWLISPERPQEFVQALSSSQSVAAQLAERA